MNPLIRCLLLSASLVLVACNSGPSNEERLAANRAARAEAEAKLRLDNLRQMQSIGRDDLALNFADDILQRFPQTQAAKEVAPIAEELRTRVAEKREATRLADLWVYHSGEDAEAGGVVRSAYVFSTEPIGEAPPGSEAPNARLVLRRHPQWGDDVYLLSERGNFRCGSPCTVEVRFDDGDWTTYPASLPQTGEPAMFVEDFTRFVRALPEAEEVRFRFALADGSEHEPRFEVGGYNTHTIGSP